MRMCLILKLPQRFWSLVLGDEQISQIRRAFSTLFCTSLPSKQTMSKIPNTFFIVIISTFLFLCFKFGANNKTSNCPSCYSLPSSDSSNLSQPLLSKCVLRDQLSYCVYKQSLCIEHGNLVILTEDISKHGSVINGHNFLAPSPLHIPDVNAIQNSLNLLPYRSFFGQARLVHSSKLSTHNWVDEWSIIANFDAQNSNIFHWVTKTQVGFVARQYEFESDAARSKGFSNAYYFRGPGSAWQLGYDQLALGTAIQHHYALEVQSMNVCFRKAVIPGAALFLTDGLFSSIKLRDMAAAVGIRVPLQQRDFITIFDHGGNRKILNLPDVVKYLKSIAPQFTVHVVKWDERNSFKEQAIHMARTRIVITTHGSVINHCMFMEPGGVVVEVGGFQWNYPLGEIIVLLHGHFYLRHEATLAHSQFNNMALGMDPFSKLSAKNCLANPDCVVTRRDANLIADMSQFSHVLNQAVSLVS